MGHVDIATMRMFYDERGPANAPLLVLLHGGMGIAGDPVYGWAGLAPTLSQHFRLVMPDHRGHGRTANPAGWTALRDLDAWLRAEGHARNPGSTADLVTACLFVALREGVLTLPNDLPWATKGEPRWTS